MNGRVYDPLTASFFSPDPYVQAPGDWLNYNRYTYCYGNPFKYTDPSGEFLTWSIGKDGLSIGLNFTPLGIPLGFGINVGWSNGGSLGIYGEVGYRVGGTGFGSGVTLNQSLTLNFENGNLSTATSANAYASFGMFNAGLNGSYTYGQNRFDWGISAGIGIGGNGSGIGFNVVYGSGGWNFGLGGYYDYSQNKTREYSLPETKNSPDGNLPIHEQSDYTVGCTQEVMESFIEYNGGDVPNLDKTVGKDFTELATDLKLDSRIEYQSIQKIGNEMRNGNPTAVTYDNGGIKHTVGINNITIKQTVKPFVGGYKTITSIQVMNPAFNTYQYLPASSFNNGVCRTLYFKK